MISSSTVVVNSRGEKECYKRNKRGSGGSKQNFVFVSGENTEENASVSKVLAAPFKVFFFSLITR